MRNWIIFGISLVVSVILYLGLLPITSFLIVMGAVLLPEKYIGTSFLAPFILYFIVVWTGLKITNIIGKKEMKMISRSTE